TEEGLPSWNGVPVVRHPERSDFRTARGLRRLLQDHNADGGVVRMTASLFFSMRQSTPPAASRGRLIGVFLRPLHGGPDLARRFLDPDLASETLLDMHHAALYASRKLGTWREASGYVDEFVFLWESDRLSAVWAGLAAGSSHVVRHPFDPSWIGRRLRSESACRSTSRRGPSGWSSQGLPSRPAAWAMSFVSLTSCLRIVRPRSSSFSGTGRSLASRRPGFA